MKKVLSLVLAVMLVVGMSTAAFAAVTLPGGAKTIDLGKITKAASGVEPIELDVDNMFPSDIDTAADDASITGTGGTDVAATMTFPAKYKSDENRGTRLEITVDRTKAVGSYSEQLTFGGTFYVTFDYEIVAASTSTPDVPSKSKIVGFSGTGFATPAALSEAGQTSELKITADMFDWVDDKGDAVVGGYPSGAKMRSSHLKDIGVRRVYQKGTAGTIKSADIKDSKSLVEVKTVDFYTKTGKTNVELKLALTFKGSTKNAPEYTYDFEIANQREWIEEGQVEAYSFGNIYLEADATVRNVEFQGSDDEIVFATKTVVKGQKYYFNVDSELSSADAQIIADNPEVDSIYTVYSTNMANATVQFKNLDREFFVYNGEGKLLGTTKDKKLPLDTKYILTTAKVDFGGADEEPVEEPTVEEPADVDAPPMGGGEVPPSNNYNPNTGL